MSSKAPFNLSAVSGRRQAFLREWRRERAIDFQLQRADVPPSDTGSGPITNVSQPSCEQPRPRPYEVQVSPGEIRLLGPGAVANPFRFAYVAVLDTYPDQGIALAAPFSPYASPATKDEWLTGLESTPLRVLQLWNAIPIPLFSLARSWRCCTLTKDELKSARELYRHTVAGTFATSSLREQTGLAIHDPADERLAYQAEEQALYAPLREALFNLQSAAETPPAAKLRDGALWLRDGGRQVTAEVRFAAGSGDVYAQAVLLPQDNVPERKFIALRLSRSRADSGEWESRWKVQEWPDAIPGLPVCAYTGAAADGLPVASSFTRGDGDLVLFQGSDPVVFEQLGRPDLWLVIREV